MPRTANCSATRRSWFAEVYAAYHRGTNSPPTAAEPATCTAELTLAALPRLPRGRVQQRQACWLGGRPAPVPRHPSAEFQVPAFDVPPSASPRCASTVVTYSFAPSLTGRYV